MPVRKRVLAIARSRGRFGSTADISTGAAFSLSHARYRPDTMVASSVRGPDQRYVVSQRTAWIPSRGAYRQVGTRLRRRCHRTRFCPRERRQETQLPTAQYDPGVARREPTYRERADPDGEFLTVVGNDEFPHLVRWGAKHDLGPVIADAVMKATLASPLQGAASTSPGSQKCSCGDVRFGSEADIRSGEP